MTEKNYIKNTAILFASMAITKIVGALFKIPLANLLGGTGMGYFSTAYGLYSPVFAVTAAGVPTVMMRITAQCIAADRCAYAAAIKRTALGLFAIIGLAGTLTVAVFAKPFAEHIACSAQSTAALLCISPAVMLCCIACVLRGYYEGMSDVMPTAAASVAEAVSRAVFGLSMSYAVLFYARHAFENGKSVFGSTAYTMEQAYENALPFAAAAAILAVSISELCGLITLVICDRKSKCPYNLPPRREYSRRTICTQLITQTVPIAASALVMNCVSFVDLLTVARTLSNSAAANTDYYMRKFSDVLGSCGGIEGLPNFMYGSYTGIAMSLFMLVPSFAGMTDKTTAPAIAAAWERKDGEGLAERIFTQLRAGAVIGAPACFGAAALAEPIMSMLYKSRAAEVSVCLNSFVILCLGGIFMVISSSLFGIFQSICKAHIPLILMLISVAVKLALNPLLLSIPCLNIAGASISSIAGYIITTVCGIVILQRYLPTKVNFAGAILPPVVCGAACGLAAYISHLILEGMINSNANTAISIFCGATVYVILLILTGIFRTSGIISQKNQIKF